jgi:hypothetical protein
MVFVFTGNAAQQKNAYDETIFEMNSPLKTEGCVQELIFFFGNLGICHLF